MYTVNNIHHFLLQEKLIDSDTVVFGDFEVTSINRRNQNIQVTTLTDPNFLIKQVKNLKSENAQTLKREAQFYDYFSKSLPSLNNYLPEVKYVDLEKVILVMTFYKDAIPLWKYYNEKTIEKFPLKTTETVGRLLGEVHNAFTKEEIMKDKRLDFLNDELPLIFNLYKPHPKRLSYIGRGGYNFIKHIQKEDDIMIAFNNIPSIWKKNALIHGDIKLDNFIILNPEDPASNQLRLVDWEMLQYGDFAWDLAGVFNDFVFWWIINMPDNETPEEMVKNAKFSFDKLHPAINVYWESYCSTRGLTFKENIELLEKVTLFSGFRLLQTSFEISSKFDAIPHIAQLFLNMGKSIIRNPELTQEKLFGISKKELIS
ncbi:aminoglycoside phosphotransferase family protein [Lacinutrix jangbogonensis]|uniref:aminoglycoside phosphotransferase family protein n=1 Tax=Lacinutrix jangbogonensis TaxID=1469557 RepID=UPI00053E5D85|nr:aminoglycoside phosphotransferase family protein [Lacinutrix jangbogonensis]